MSFYFLSISFMYHAPQLSIKFEALPIMIKESFTTYLSASFYTTIYYLGGTSFHTTPYPAAGHLIFLDFFLADSKHIQLLF